MMKSHDDIINFLDPPIATPIVEPPRELYVRARIKIAFMALSVAVGALSFYYRDFLWHYFGMFLMLSFDCFAAGEVGLGIIVLVIQLIAWGLAFILFYFGFLNLLFPRLTGVNSMRTKNIFARKIVNIVGPDPYYIYCKVKFKLFPIFDWYTMKIPKNVKFVRMPNSLELHSPNIDLIWRDCAYYITTDHLTRKPDLSTTYSTKAQKSIKAIGETIGDAIQGDSNMMKDYYTMNLTMDENREPIPKKNLQRPPSDLEREASGF
jgi:hypothetical protein